MTLLGAATDVGREASLGTLYKESGQWGVWLAFWRTCWPWSGQPWSYGTSYAAGLLTERRRGGSGALETTGRPNRRRRTYLRRAHAAAGRRAQERGRRWQDFLREHPGAE